jgi:hypothetical protein
MVDLLSIHGHSKEETDDQPNKIEGCYIFNKTRMMMSTSLTPATVILHTNPT